MIGMVRGILIEKQSSPLLVEVQGIGYEIDVPASIFSHLPERGQPVTLHTHFVVREDAQQLYGFYHRNERDLFRTLLKVNGVGPRLALTILSSMLPNAFARCVAANDAASLVHVPGIGKKTAQRLIIEMRDKLSDELLQSNDPLQPTQADRTGRYHLIQDAVAALVALGYKQIEAGRMVARIDDHQAGSEELIRRALKELK